MAYTYLTAAHVGNPVQPPAFMGHPSVPATTAWDVIVADTLEAVFTKNVDTRGCQNGADVIAIAGAPQFPGLAQEPLYDCLSRARSGDCRLTWVKATMSIVVPDSPLLQALHAVSGTVSLLSAESVSGKIRFFSIRSLVTV